MSSGPSPGAAAQSGQGSPGPTRTGPLRNPVNAMPPARPAELHWCRGRLTGLAAAAEARSRIRAASCAGGMSLSTLRKEGTGDGT